MPSRCATPRCGCIRKIIRPFFLTLLFFGRRGSDVKGLQKGSRRAELRTLLSGSLSLTFVTCEVRVCGLRCRSGSSLYIYTVCTLFGESGLWYLRMNLFFVSARGLCRALGLFPLASFNTRTSHESSTPRRPPRGLALAYSWRLLSSRSSSLHLNNCCGSSVCSHAPRIPTARSVRCVTAIWASHPKQGVS